MLSREDNDEYLLLIISPARLFAKWSLRSTGTIEKIPFKEITCGVEPLVKDSIWSEHGEACSVLL